MFNKRIQTK